MQVLDITKFSLAEQFKALDKDGDAAITEKDVRLQINSFVCSAPDKKTDLELSKCGQSAHRIWSLLRDLLRRFGGITE